MKPEYPVTKSLAGLSVVPDDACIFERPRINALLEKALGNQVVLVNAGAGYGKTTAVYSFLSKRNEPVVWIPFSERDNDPAHFWESIINAEGIYQARIKKTLEKIGFPETSDQISRCCQILSEVVPGNRKLVFVADDCHLIRGESILSFVKRIVTFPFPRMTFILISQTEPELNTMSLLSKGLLSRLSGDDLRFNEEEIGDYFRLRNISLAGEDPGKIFADTEGWAEAINIIAEEMKGGKKKYSRFLLESGSFRIMEETLFASIPAPLRRFLIILSLFDQWPLEAFEKIAAAMPDRLPPIEDLTGNMCRLSSLIHYDTYLHGFRIHRVFLDYLREKQKELSRDEIKTACLLSARWCRENNLHIDAAANFGRAGDYRELLVSVYSLPRLMPRPSAAALLEIVDKLLENGEQNIEDENFLFLRHVTKAGLVLNLGRFDEARMLLNLSIRRFETRPSLPLHSKILSACYNTLGALSFLTYRQDRDISKTAEYFERGDYYYSLHPFPYSGPMNKASLGYYINPVGNSPRPGEFESFINAVARSVPYASRSLGGYLSGADSLCRAEFAYFKGDLNAAEQYARKAVFDAREKRQYEIESKGLFYLYRIHLCNGNACASRETWEQIEAQLDVPDYINRYTLYDIMTGWFNAHVGRPEQIALWLRNEFMDGRLNMLFHNYEAMVKAKTLFAEKKYEEALEFLARREITETLGSYHLGLLEITVMEAAIHGRMGDDEGALKILESAYFLSLPNSFDLPFIELGEDMRILAGTALNSDGCAIDREWLETTRNKASGYAKKLSAAAEHYHSRRNPEEAPSLTSQESFILEGISRGLTREEIADSTSLSIHSVKNIIKTIYGKLGAFNRADAIRIATSQGLLKTRIS